jgi:hypothetical protein
MRSVFVDKFENIINRIDSVSQSARSSQTQQSTHGEKFAKLLGDLELKENTPNKDSALAAHGLSLNNELTNLNPVEKERLAIELETKKFEVSPQLLHPARLDLSQVLGVKDSPLDVKISSLQEETPKVTESEIVPVPSPVKMISAKRVESPKLPTTVSYETGKIQNMIAKTSEEQGIPAHLGLAVATAESSLNPYAISRDGFHSKGLFQLLDSTAADMMDQFNIEKSSYNPYDPQLNSQLGLAYLKKLHNIFATETTVGKNLTSHPASSAANLEKLAVAAFNAGEGTVVKAQQEAQRRGKDPSNYLSVEPHLPAITRTYVGRVTRYKDEFENLGLNVDQDLG